MKLRGTWLILAMALLSGSADAQTFKREELRVPAPGAGKQGLETLFVKPDLPGLLPLVVITHGSPVKPEDRKTATPLLYLPHAMEFVRRGWAAAIVMRRGFGNSGGEYTRGSGTCERPDFTGAVNAAAGDIRASIVHLTKRSDVDGSRVVAVGQSAGGLAIVGLTVDPPPGLIAVINFAGGQFAAVGGKPCARSEDSMVGLFKTYGKRSRTPMLWIYSQNDSLFHPALVQRFKGAFSSGGGKVELISAPPFGTDGHGLFSLAGIPIWTPYVDQFLKTQNLPNLPIAEIAQPSQLTEPGRKSFEEFLRRPPHRAFAVSPGGAYGWESGLRTVEEARKLALERCSKHASDCEVVVIDYTEIR